MLFYIFTYKDVTMKNIKYLQASQIDSKIKAFRTAEGVPIPSRGWIYGIRTSLNMTLRQLALKLGYIPQAIARIEESEYNETITLKTLKAVANALDMKLVYGFVPKEGTLKNKIEAAAYEKAKQIVLRTSNTMRLEDQENSNRRIQQAIKEKAIELKNDIPKFLWD